MKTSNQLSGIGHCGKWMIGALLTGGAIYFLFPEYQPQIINALPFLILLLCPLMHVFMHRGHGEKQDKS